MQKEKARTQLEAVGEFIERTADSMTLTSDPQRRAAASAWLKTIRRELAKLRNAPKAA